MGFGTVAANMIMFISVILLAGGLLLTVNVYVQETQQELTQESDRLTEEIGTNIHIQNVNYTENATGDGQITAYVKNDGRTDLTTNTTDIYIEGERIARSDRDITVTDDTQITDERIWSPSEVIQIDTTKNLSSGRRTFKVVTENGISDEQGFDV